MQISRKNAIFVIHPDRLYHLVTRSGRSAGEDGAEPEHSIATTGEHPFWVVEKQDFVRASALNPGDTFLTREWKNCKFPGKIK